MCRRSAVAVIQEKDEVCCGLFHGFDWSPWVHGTPQQSLPLLPAAQEHILGLKEGKQRLLHGVDDVAFYDALSCNDSAVAVLGDAQLRAIAREPVSTVKGKVTIDWSLRESVRAELRSAVKRIPRTHGNPPVFQAKATDTVIEQAETLSEVWVLA